MPRLACLVLVACSSPEPARAPAPSPTPAPVHDASVVVAPALTPELAARWNTGCLLVRLPSGLVETDRARCNLPRRPYSTFKLANALIGLDAGVLAGADAPMPWDKRAVPDEKRYRDEWRKPHTLRSAIKVSAVPQFRTLARTIGEQRMVAGLTKLAYGNRSIGGGIDQFWLREGELRISAAQQLAFVDALARGKLAVSQPAQAVVREISELERRGDRVLHGKTGSGMVEDGSGRFLVWQVGWIENGTQIVPYAAWVEVTGGTFDEARGVRDALLGDSFTALGVF